MGAAGANENFYLWSRFSSLDIRPAEEQEKKNRHAEPPSKSLQACALKEHNLVLTRIIHERFYCESRLRMLVSQCDRAISRRTVKDNAG